MKRICRLLTYALVACTVAVSCDKEETEVDRPVATPRLVSIIPASGTEGSIAIISGVNLSSETEQPEVTIGGEAAEILHAGAERLTVVLPANPLGEAAVAVRVGGRTADGLAFTYVEQPDPSPLLLNVIPSSGYAGDRLVIYGRGFGKTPSENAVTIGGEAAEVTFATSSILHVTAPEHAEGSAAIVLTTGGESVSGFSFEYLHVPVLSIARIAPASGRAGETVVLTGECFSTTPADNHLTINGVAVEILEATSTQLTVRMPENPDGSYPFLLHVGDAQVEGPVFTYVPRKYYVASVAGNGTMGTTDGIGAAASFNTPQDIHYDREGMFWIVDRGSYSIRKMDPESCEVTTLVAGSEPLLSGKYPWQGDFNSEGDFYVVCKGGNNIIRITPAGKCSEYAVENSNFSNPMALVFDPEDRIYLADRSNNRIVQIVSGRITGEYEIDMPQTVAIDRNGKLLVGMYRGNQLQMIDPQSGTVTPIAGSGTKPTAVNYTDGEAGKPLTATIGTVDGIYCASDGTVYFTDEVTATVRKLVPGTDGSYATGTVTTLAGQPLLKGWVDGEALTTAKFTYPYGILLAADGETLYVTDGSGSRRIRKLYLN